MSTGYVLHTLQASLWCLLKTSGYAECVLKAVSLGEDTDTTAAVAGALAGLWYGAKQIPKKWAENTAKYEEIKAKTKKFYYACLKNTKTGRSSSEFTP
jgi:ADP-ribosylglycohydrolase